MTPGVKKVVDRCLFLGRLALMPVIGIVAASVFAPEDSNKFLLRSIGLTVGLLVSYVWLASDILIILRNRAIVIPPAEDNSISATAIVSDLNRLLETLATGNPTSPTLLAKCAGVAVSRLRIQIEDQFITILSQGISDDSVRAIMLEAATKADRVVSTCLSAMDDFWCNEKTGPDYLSLNIRIAAKTGKEIERVIKVSGESWRSTELKKRELTRLLMAQGWTCYVIEEKEFADRGLEEQDLFLMVDDKGHPLIGIEWQLDSSGTPSSITLTLSPGKLSRLLEDYEKMRGRATKLDPYRLEIVPTDEDKACRQLRNLSADVLGDNSTAYLRTPLEDPKQIAEYWHRLEGTIVRPSPATLVWLRSELDKLVGQHKLRKVGILGCTPEVRQLMSTEFPETPVLVVDLSQRMYDGTSHYLKEYQSVDLAKEKFYPANWLSLSSEMLLVDAVIGIDVLNMVPPGRGREPLNRLLQAIESILIPGGTFLTQAVCDSLPSHLAYDNLHNLHNRLDKVAADLRARGFSDHDIFVHIAFALMKVGEDAPDVLDLPAAYDLITGFYSSEPGFKQLSQVIGETYSSCNSRLTLFRPYDLDESLSKRMNTSDTEPAHHGGLRFTQAMFLFKATKKL